MLPVVDQRGTLTCYVMVLYSLLLVPLTLALTPVGVTGTVYAGGALLLGGGLLWLVWRLCRERSAANARRVFLASVIYLPLLLGLMLIDRPGTQPRAAIHQDQASAAATEIVAAIDGSWGSQR